VYREADISANLEKRRNKMDKNQIIEALKGMTILEINELVQACEEEFGVSAAAAVVAAPAAGGGEAAEEQVEEAKDAE